MRCRPTAARIFGVPLVLDLHDLMPELFESRWSARRTRLLGPLVRFAEKVSVQSRGRSCWDEPDKATDRTDPDNW